MGPVPGSSVSTDQSTLVAGMGEALSHSVSGVLKSSAPNGRNISVMFLENYLGRTAAQQQGDQKHVANLGERSIEIMNSLFPADYLLSMKAADIPISKQAEMVESESKKLLFSPELGEAVWSDQLNLLKKHKAKCGNLEVADFDRVNVAPVGELFDQKHILKKDQSQPSSLRVLTLTYGKLDYLQRGMRTLTLLPGDTLVGAGSEITVNGERLKFALPKTELVFAEKEKNSLGWWDYTLENRDGKRIGLIGSQSFAGTRMYHPVVVLAGANLMGVELDCKGRACGVLGGYGDISIRDNVIHNYHMIGIGVTQGGAVSVSGNQLSAHFEGDKKTAIPIRGYDSLEKEENVITVYPGGEGKSSQFKTFGEHMRDMKKAGIRFL